MANGFKAKFLNVLLVILQAKNFVILDNKKRDIQYKFIGLIGESE